MATTTELPATDEWCVMMVDRIDDAACDDDDEDARSERSIPVSRPLWDVVYGCAPALMQRMSRDSGDASFLFSGIDESMLPQGVPPLPEKHVPAAPAPAKKRDNIESIINRLRNEMDDRTFSLKCKVYQEEIARIGLGSDRKRIYKLAQKPVVFLSTAEQQIADMIPHDVDLDTYSQSAAGQHLTELLMAVVNKGLFLLVVEYQTWYWSKPVRQDLAHATCKAIWGDRAAPMHHKFVSRFVDERAKNFRDVISRYVRKLL